MIHRSGWFSSMVVVGVDAPHLVRPADEVDAELRQDVGGVVQRLGEVLDAPPDQDVQRPRVVASGAPDDPVRALRRLADARGPRPVDGPLPGDRPQGVGPGVSGGMRHQVGVVALVGVDDPQDVRLPPRAEGRGDEPLDVEDVRVEEQVHHRLEVVRVGPADVGGDEDAGPIAGRRAALGGDPVGTEDEQGPDRDGPSGRSHGGIPLRRAMSGPGCLDPGSGDATLADYPPRGTALSPLIPLPTCTIPGFDAALR